MNKFAITIFSLLTLSVAQALAQNTNQPVDNQPSSEWFQTVFSDLWMACIERDADVQYIEHQVQPNRSAKALYRTWVNNACTVPGNEHYYNIKPGCGSPAEVSPVIYGPPEIEGKPILSPAEGISLMVLIKDRHEHLYNYARDYVREPSGKMHESAKKALVEMCGIEAVEKLDASLTKRKQTESANANSIESNWYKHEFSVLWQSHIEKDPEINHFEEKLIPNKSAKTLYRTWVTNLCVTPGEKPYIAVTARDGHSPNIVPAFHGSPKADGKPILSPMDAATAQFTVELNHDRLETAYRSFIGEATEEKRLRAKQTLVEMCGEEAVRRLDTKIAERNAETTETSEANR